MAMPNNDDVPPEVAALRRWQADIELRVEFIETQLGLTGLRQAELVLTPGGDEDADDVLGR